MKRKYQKPELLRHNVDNFGEKMTKSTTTELVNAFSDDSIIKFREASEVYNMRLLEKAVDAFESFYSSEGKKTLGECVEENGIDDFHHVLNVCSGQALIRLFSECEDEYLEGIVNEDIDGFGENNIRLSQPLRGNISTKKIIKEIRDGISHRRYILGKDGIYIFNPKGGNHKINFKASIGWELFTNIHTIRKFTQKFRRREVKNGGFVLKDDDNTYYSVYDESDLNWEELAEIFPPMSEYDYNKIIEKSLENFKENKGEQDNSGKFGSGGNFVDNIGKIKVKEYKIQKKSGVKLSDLQSDDTNFSIEGEHIGLSNEQYKLLDDYFKEHNLDLDGFRFAFGHLENVRPHIIDHLFMNRIINGINNVGESYKNLQILQGNKNNENNDKSVDFLEFFEDCVSFPSELISSQLISHCYELVPTYLKMLYIINSYLNDTNVTMGSGENMNETTHIRHALAHGHYSLLPGVKDVLLYDPRCNYHGKFDIDKMYKERKEYERKRKDRLEN